MSNQLLNSLERLDRSLRRLGIIVQDSDGVLKKGKTAGCLQLLRRLLFATSPVVEKQMQLKGRFLFFLHTCLKLKLMNRLFK